MKKYVPFELDEKYVFLNLDETQSFFFLGSHPVSTSMQFKCKLVEGSPNHVLSSLSHFVKACILVLCSCFQSTFYMSQVVNPKKRD